MPHVSCCAYMCVQRQGRMTAMACSAVQAGCGSARQASRARGVPPLVPPGIGSVSRLEYPRVSLCPRVSSCHALVCSSSGSYAPPISVMSRARHVSRASVFYRIVRPCRSACRALCGASRPCGAVCALRAYLLLYIFIPLSRVRSGVAFGLRASVGFGAEPSRVPGDSQHNVRPRAAGRGPRRNATRFASRHSFAVPHVPCLSFQPRR